MIKSFILSIILAIPIFAQTNANTVFVVTAPSGACMARSNLRLRVSTGALYSCQGGTWAQIGGTAGTVTSVTGTGSEITVTGTTAPVLSIASAFDISAHASTAPIKKGLNGNIPATCNPGEFYASTDAGTGANLNFCSPANTWTIIGDFAVNKRKTCVIIIGDPGAASSALADDNDSPVACANDIGSDWTIDRVGCWANAGSPTITPILTGGTATSILTGALTCGTAAWAAGTVNGSPVIHSFSAGATCSSTPCTADVNITTAGGTAKYIAVRISGLRP